MNHMAFFLLYIVKTNKKNICFVESGCVLDDERVRQYATVINKGSSARFSFAAAIFGETLEACFWLQLPRALKHLLNMLANKSLHRAPVKVPSTSIDDTSLLTRMFSKGRSVARSTNTDIVVSFLFLFIFELSISLFRTFISKNESTKYWYLYWQNDGQLRMMAFDQEELWENASERITWHEMLEGEQAIQNRIHE